MSDWVAATWREARILGLSMPEALFGTHLFQQFVCKPLAPEYHVTGAYQFHTYKWPAWLAAVIAKLQQEDFCSHKTCTSCFGHYIREQLCKMVSDKSCQDCEWLHLFMQIAVCCICNSEACYVLLMQTVNMHQHMRFDVPRLT